MGTGYTRNDTANNIADGNIINASDLDGEFNAVESAFVAATGHTHDGTAAEGGPITVVGPAQDFVVSASEIKPKTTNTLDIGTNALQFKDLYLDGEAFVDDLDVSNVITLSEGTNDWTIEVDTSDSDAVVVKHNGTALFKLDTSGNATFAGNVTGFGTL